MTTKQRTANKRKPAKNHPWNAQGKLAIPNIERASEPPCIAERKPHRRLGAA